MYGYGYGFNNPANQAIRNELVTDLWIQQNIPGGLNSKLIEILFSLVIYFLILTYAMIKMNKYSKIILNLGPLGEMIDNMAGGNPNPTLGQIYGGYPGVGGFYGYRAW